MVDKVFLLIATVGFADDFFTISREDAKKTFHCHEGYGKPVITQTKLYPVCQFSLWCEPTSSSPVNKRQVYRTACRANDDGSCPRTEEECHKRAKAAETRVIVAHAFVAEAPKGQRETKPGRKCHYEHDLMSAIWLPKKTGGYFAFCSNDVVCEDADKSAPALTPIVACDTKYGFRKIDDPNNPGQKASALVCPPEDECVAEANIMKSELATVAENKTDEKVSAKRKASSSSNLELAGELNSLPHAKQKELLSPPSGADSHLLRQNGI